MYSWILIYACCLKAPLLRSLWTLWSLKLVCSDCRRRVVSDLSDHWQFCRFWCERPVRQGKSHTWGPTTLRGLPVHDYRERHNRDSPDPGRQEASNQGAEPSSQPGPEQSTGQHPRQWTKSSFQCGRPPLENTGAKN